MTEPTEPNRLHIAAAFVRIAGNIPYIVFLLVASLFGGDAEAGQSSGTEALIYLAIIPLIVGHGLIRWWRFRYWIEDGEFRVLDGAIVRREIFIPFEKIRTVEVNEGLWQRIFGVVRLQVKTGATGTQADLTAVSKAEADRIQHALKQKTAVEGAEAAEPGEEEPERKRVVSFGEIIAAGATSGRLGFLAAFALWVFGETAEFTVDPIVEWATSLPADDTTRMTLFVAGAVALIVGLILSFLGSIIATFVKYGKFSVARTDDKIVIQHGLLSRQTITLPLHRIQAIRFVQNPVRELMGAGTLLVEAIGHSEQKGRSSELYPLIGIADLDDFLADMVPEFCGEVELERPPRRALLRFLFLPTLISTIPGMVLTAMFEAPGAAAFLLVPATVFFRYLAWKQTGFGATRNLAWLQTRSILSRELAIFPRRAVRSLGTDANIFQRRRSLATLKFTVASGAMGKTFMAPNLEDETADRSLGWRPGVTPDPDVVQPAVGQGAMS